MFSLKKKKNLFSLKLQANLAKKSGINFFSKWKIIIHRKLISKEHEKLSPSKKETLESSDIQYL